jgi:hypothetical protein
MAITPSGYQLLVGDGINNVVKTVNLNTGARPHFSVLASIFTAAQHLLLPLNTQRQSVKLPCAVIAWTWMSVLLQVP